MSSTSRKNGTVTGEVGPGKPPVEHQFKPGNPGRPKGARSKLGEAFLEALLEDFTEHGVAAIVKVRDEKPDQYLKVVASILPKEIQAEVSHRYVARMPTPAESVEGGIKEHAPKATVQ